MCRAGENAAAVVVVVVGRNNGQSLALITDTHRTRIDTKGGELRLKLRDYGRCRKLRPMCQRWPAAARREANLMHSSHRQNTQTATRTTTTTRVDADEMARIKQPKVKCSRFARDRTEHGQTYTRREWRKCRTKTARSALVCLVRRWVCMCVYMECVKIHSATASCPEG